MMKLVVGMGTAEDYRDFVEAGADEIFCGFIPQEWQTRYGLGTPLNRREVCYYNVQLGSESELEILAREINELGMPVSLAFNGLAYQPEQYPMLEKIIASCLEIGFSSYIIADPGLFLHLKESGLGSQLDLHVSGEFGEMNRFSIGMLKGWGADRIIFHRHVTIEEMRSIREAHPELAYEAFFLNEKCQFLGGYCSSLHCDEMAPACRERYRLGQIREDACADGSEEWSRNCGKACSRNSGEGCSQGSEEVQQEIYELPGSSGCGFCALWKLRAAGVTHLKIVGRGAYTEDMLRDIRAARRALEILETSQSEEEYLTAMRAELFPKGCSGQCYYTDEGAAYH